jgi:2-iminoacetate synthase
MKEIVDQKLIYRILEESDNPGPHRIRDILRKAREKKGLNLDEVGSLVNLNNPDIRKELFDIARSIKEEIYGERLVFFAPLYVSDFCVNDCDYCNFHLRNKELKRRKLSLEEIEREVKVLLEMGHKRLLLEFGEDPANSIDYVVDVIKKIYSTGTEKGNIRRINVNIAPTSKENYRKLKAAGIGTYQLFQETYHRPAYEKLHHGPKADYERQLSAHDRAFEGGLDDVGLGVLFGLYDWRFEVLGLIAHAQHLERKFGVGPHTISVPRFCEASTVNFKPAYAVPDEEFLKIIAILRLAVPYTGMIISTRERADIREIAYKTGISQSSAASVTVTGGYSKKCSEPCPFPPRRNAPAERKGRGEPQFEIHDTRSLYTLINDILKDKLLPSFCTACYRLGRTGKDFMDIAKPGRIHNFCRPNGLLTFAEYLEDFAQDGLYERGMEVINFYLNKIEDAGLRGKTKERLVKIKQGERDLYF